MKLLFQMELNDDFSQESIDIFLENSIFSDLGLSEEQLAKRQEMGNYIRDFATEFILKKDSVDALIEENLQGWSLNRIAKVDLAILRVAVFEFLYTSIPKEVSINEAIEIAKEYSREDSSKFINGILGSIYRVIG